jgi:hypothetical protein
MASKVKTAVIPTFRPFTTAEKAEMKKLDKAMATITAASELDIRADIARKAVREHDKANSEAFESARKFLLKHKFTKPVILAAKATFQSTYCYIERIDTSGRRGKGAIAPSLERAVQMLVALVAKHTHVRRDVMASNADNAGDERKVETRNATMTLLRMLPAEKAPAEKPSEAASNFGARLATMPGFEKFNPSSITDAKFKQVMEWILGGLHGKRVEEGEKQEMEDAKAAVESAKTPKAKAAATARLTGCVKSARSSVKQQARPRGYCT